MQSFAELDRVLASQPPRVGVQLAAINRGQGRQDLFAAQVPQVLERLAQTTRIASITASTAIEGYDVPDQRARAIVDVDDDSRFRNRNEREFAGYRDAADAVSRQWALTPLSPATPLILAGMLHKHSTGEPGRITRLPNEIAERDENGVRRLIFTPVAPEHAEAALRELTARYNQALDDQAADPALLVGLYALDFLAIHPVADGNGRLARLLTSHELLRLGYEVPRYISVEQMILDTKWSYYAALEASQRNWHDSQHDAWPWLTYFTMVLADAYTQFEHRVNANRTQHGNKADRVREWALYEANETFTFQGAVDALPGISAGTIRVGLDELRKEGRFEVSRGRNATWMRIPAGDALRHALQEQTQMPAPAPGSALKQPRPVASPQPHRFPTREH
jgi:Fic family protein